jgi:hypothetical protein
MPIRVQCDCGKHLSAKDHLAGKRVKCPDCGKYLTLAESSGAESKSLRAGAVGHFEQPPEDHESPGTRKGAVRIGLWVGWSIFTVLAGVLLVLDVRRTEAETDIWDPDHDLLKPVPNVGLNDAGDGYVTITRSSPGDKVVQRYTGAGLQIVYAGVSEERVYDNMGEFEMNGRKYYCTSVTGHYIKRPHDTREWLPSTIGSHIYGRQGDIYITYDIADAYKQPVDLRGFGERVRDYWTLSKKAIPSIFLLLMLAGIALLIWTLLRRRRGGIDPRPTTAELAEPL